MEITTVRWALKSRSQVVEAFDAVALVRTVILNGEVFAVNYMLAPLNQHYDDGFGAMGLSFSNAADGLLKQNEGTRDFFLEHMPINFLLRHSRSEHEYL